MSKCLKRSSVGILISKYHTTTIAWRETISTDYTEAEKVTKKKQNKTLIGKLVRMEEQQQQTVVESDL